jgi:hypothetical protein
VSALRELIPDYAGHADAPARRLSDQQVRAWAGESLVDVQERLGLGADSGRFEKLLLRCEFGDYYVIKALEDARFGAEDTSAAVERYDRNVVAAAAEAKTLTAAGLDAFVAGLERALDERAAGVSALLKR